MSSENVAFDVNEHPHNRYNPLRDEWVLVSPHRMKRPWSGQVERGSSKASAPRFDPTNPLCPRVRRSNGQLNPDYTTTYTFDNDFPALFDYDVNDDSAATDTDDTDDPIARELFRVEPAKGACKVMCFHPHSDVTLATMDLESVVRVVEAWSALVAELKADYDYVQIFENRGEVMGCSNMHPHCQVWASRNFLPSLIRLEDHTQRAFYAKHNGKCMLVEYLRRELSGARPRLVLENESWAVVVPYWAVWPYETMVLPKRHVHRLDQLAEAEKRSLAHIIKQLLIKYDNMFECSFPYSMGFHQAPSGSHLVSNVDHWQLFASYLPPLLRSSTIKKFMVGYEMLAQPQRDLTPEKAAERLRQLSGTRHYTVVVDADAASAAASTGDNKQHEEKT